MILCPKCGKNNAGAAVRYDDQTDTLVQRCIQCGYLERRPPKDATESSIPPWADRRKAGNP